MTDSTEQSNVELYVDAERITPELRQHLEYRLAKSIAARALLDLDIQLLEIALGSGKSDQLEASSASSVAPDPLS